MRWYRVVVVCVAAAARPGAAGAQTPSRGAEPDLGGGARAVFAARCAGCHGPDVPRPRGRFGYVLDLQRMAANPELVIPSRPAESELWVLIDHGDMPPADSPQGALTAAEKDMIRAWIAAGAPDARPPAHGVSDPPPAPAPPPVAPPAWRALRWVGKFHLLLLHLPIALVLAAAVGEGLSAWRGIRAPSPAVRFCLALAAVAVIPTVALGWVHAATGGGAGSAGLLTAHRWLGTVAGVWVVGTALWAERDARRRADGRGVRVALVAVGVLLVAATAHVGGLMAHGSDFFDW